MFLYICNYTFFSIKHKNPRARSIFIVVSLKICNQSRNSICKAPHGSVIIYPSINLTEAVVPTYVPKYKKIYFLGYVFETSRKKENVSKEQSVNFLIKSYADKF